MGTIINDKDVCPQCGAYWGTNGFCSNGHAKPDNKDIEEKPKVNKKRLIVYGIILAAFIILSAVAIYLDSQPIVACTPDNRFCSAILKDKLQCGDGYIYNATNGPPKPADPDYYFCTPYPKQPIGLFFYTGENYTLNMIFDQSNNAEVVVFTDDCPLDRQTQTDFPYRIYVGDWKNMWNKCGPYNELTYLYGVDHGYKHICCLPANKIVSNVSLMRKDVILLYNQTTIHTNQNTTTTTIEDCTATGCPIKLP
jgi:hypothetical protein